MKKILISGLTLFLLFGLRPLPAHDSGCQVCHTTMHSSCGLRCQDCHLSVNAPRNPKLNNHPAVIANPSQERWWAEKCQRCHQKEMDDFKNSLHYSSAGIIDQTRFLFAKTAHLLQTAPDAWHELSKISKVEQPVISGLADHLLASKCLGCHFASDRHAAAKGRKHAAGCAACHVPLDQQTGKPLNGHRFVKLPADAVCLACHSGNRTGADYYGYFEHDYHKQYQTPFGSRPQFGAYQHRLRPDVHLRAGLHCTDCHTEHKGHRVVQRFEGQQADVRCSDCHGGFNLRATRTHARAPAFSQQIVAHKSYHARLRCSACHAQWAYQDYGLHLFLDESKHYEMWADYLWQGDGEVTRLLKEQLRLPESKRTFAFSRNKLSGKIMKGIWYVAWTFRRWENPVLGIDPLGKVSIVRPLYQYFLTYADSLDRVWLDSQKPMRKDGKIGWNWDAFVPHTIGKKGRSCESCHLNAKAVGLGIRQNIADSVANPITLPTQPVLPGSRLLNKKERQRLLHKSRNYRYWRTKAYLQNGILKLFEDK